MAIFPQTLPANTVIGRLNTGPGPAQAVTTAELLAAIGLAPPANSTIEFIMDGGGVALTAGVKGYIEVPFAGVITRARMFADISGSAVVDIWRTTYSAFDGGGTHPVVGDSICASARPTIASSTKSSDATLTGWTTALAAGDVLAFNLVSAATITRLTISLLTIP